MKTLMLCVVALGAACDKKPSGPALKLPAPTYAVGQTVRMHNDASVQLTIEAPNGRRGQLMYRKVADDSKEVLAVDEAGNITKQKVTYETRDESMTVAGETEQQTSPTTGQSYLVWAEGGEVKVSRVDGSAPPEDELTEVLDEHEDFAVPDPMGQAIAKRTWYRGQRVTFSEAELAGSQKQSRAGTKAGTSSAQMTLRGVEDGVARFVVRMQMNVRNEGLDLTMDASGTLAIEVATGQIIELAIAGPAHGQAAGMSSSGQMTLLAERR